MFPHWFSMHVAYTMAKYGMSMCVLGMAEEFKPFGVAVNALWPKTAIHTAAIEMLSGPESDQFSRKPDIMADAAYAVLSGNPKTTTGNFFVDEDVLKKAGITDMKQYACVPENSDKLMPDFFLDVLPEAYNQGFISKEAPKKSGGGDGVNIEGLFSKIEGLISPELVSKTNAIYQFNVKGTQSSNWFLDLKNTPGKCGKGDAPTQPDTILTMDSKNFYDMFSGKFTLIHKNILLYTLISSSFVGKIKPAAAFMTGKLKISGDLQKAMKLEKLMGSLKSKL